MAIIASIYLGYPVLGQSQSNITWKAIASSLMQGIWNERNTGMFEGNEIPNSD